jgi:hypothetical protein
MGINEEEFDGETLSYLITTLLERFPVEGEELPLDIVPLAKDSLRTLTIKVLQISGNTIGDLKISLH